VPVPRSEDQQAEEKAAAIARPVPPDRGPLGRRRCRLVRPRRTPCPDHQPRRRRPARRRVPPTAPHRTRWGN